MFKDHFKDYFKNQTKNHRYFSILENKLINTSKMLSFFNQKYIFLFLLFFTPIQILASEGFQFIRLKKTCFFIEDLSREALFQKSINFLEEAILDYSKKNQYDQFFVHTMIKNDDDKPIDFFRVCQKENAEILINIKIYDFHDAENDQLIDVKIYNDKLLVVKTFNEDYNTNQLLQMTQNNVIEKLFDLLNAKELLQRKQKNIILEHNFIKDFEILISKDLQKSKYNPKNMLSFLNDSKKLNLDQHPFLKPFFKQINSILENTEFKAIENQTLFKSNQLLFELGIEMISIPSASFSMGEKVDYSEKKATNKADFKENQPEHIVDVYSFEISKTEITVAQYAMCVKAEFCTAPKSYLKDPYCNWENPIKNNHPINCVSWHQAVRFAQWTNSRLTTEAEWEYIVKKQPLHWLKRGGCQETVILEEDDPDCGHIGTAEVCSRKRGNIENICDLFGNVAEWMSDEFHYSYLNAPKTSKPWCDHENCIAKKHVIRGGSWASPLLKKTTNRIYGISDVSYSGVGFRISR